MEEFHASDSIGVSASPQSAEERRRKEIARVVSRTTGEEVDRRTWARRVSAFAVAICGEGELRSVSEAAFGPSGENANRANASPGKRFRTIAFNVHRCEGTVPRFLQAKKARAPACVGKKFADALASLAPDLVTFAEAPDEALCRIIADRLKMSCVYFPSRSAYPGVLLSTWRITESQDRAKQAPAGLFSRHWGSAILRDGTRAVIVHSAHLHPNHRSKRRREIEILSQAIQPELAGGKMVLAQGDFNHSPRATEYREWIRRGLIDAFDAKGIGAGETFPSIQPVMRIDYVFVSPSLAPRLRLARTLSDSPFRRQFPQACLSDHLPAAAEFEF